MTSTNKKTAQKRTEHEPVWRDSRHYWIVRRGRLVPPPGPEGKIKSLFRVVAEKIPFDALTSVKQDLKARQIRTEGVYIAHDSMGSARYIGRGNVISRLETRKKAQPLELLYFSFYLVLNKKHEREIETLLIRAAGPLLHFNEKKKRVDIESGSVKDYEAGTAFFERQRKKGKKRPPTRQARVSKKPLVGKK